MPDFNYFKEKVKFFSGEFRYEFNKEEYKLILFTDNNEKLINIQRQNFRNIYDMKNTILESNDNHYKWYLEECITCFSNEITFKVKYFMEYFSEDLESFKITMTSPVINEIFHPAKYFYHNIDKANNDILYRNIIMKQDEFKLNGIRYEITILIGNLLDRGICSGFSDYVKMEIKTDKEIDLKEIIQIVDKVKSTFEIIGLTKSISFDNIEIGSENRFIFRIHEKEKKLQDLLPNINLFFNDIFIKILKKCISSNSLEYKFFCKNDNEVNFLYLCKAFEQNFKIRFPRFKDENRNEEEQNVINELINTLEKMPKNNFTNGLKHKLNIYKNKFFSQLMYVFNYYEKYFENSNEYTYAIDSIKYLKMKQLDNIVYDDFIYSAKRINELRNIMAHDDLDIKFSLMDKFWINAFGYIVYIMILENLDLTQEEILDLLVNIHINIVN